MWSWWEEIMCTVTNRKRTKCQQNPCCFHWLLCTRFLYSRRLFFSPRQLRQEQRQQQMLHQRQQRRQQRALHLLQQCRQQQVRHQPLQQRWQQQVLHQPQQNRQQLQNHLEQEPQVPGTVWPPVSLTLACSTVLWRIQKQKMLHALAHVMALAVSLFVCGVPWDWNAGGRNELQTPVENTN